MRDAWAASPTRFREDANAEEDLRLGGYARSWLVELAQNAADAARAAGVAGRLRVAVEDGELRVANTGAPLDAPGVAALASLRASAKRDGRSVGRFGVGFAAVLALSDAPRVVSGTGGVAFSAERTARAVRGLAGAAAELERRDGQLPVLRLVWPVGDDEPPIPDGYDTEVRLPLRPGTDPAALLTEAGADAAALLLALPDLAEITVGGAVLRREDGPAARVTTAWLVTDGRREAWLLARASGELDAGEIAALAVEQRGFAAWSVCWALPVDADGRPEPATRPDEMRNSRRWDAQLAGGPGVGAGDGVVAGITGDGVLAGGAAGEVLHAPTATAERLSLPARLIATVPLDPDRRHVRPGPATERVLAAAAAAYVHLVAALAPADRLALVPAAGFPRSEVDGRLRELVLAALTGADWLPGADGTDVAPSRAEWLDLPGEDLPGLLAESGAFPGLLAVPQRPPTALGIARLGPAAMADRLIGVEMAPSWWRAVYAALAPAVDAVPGLAEELGALPVPLLGGRSPGMGQERRMRGPRHTPGDLRTVPGPAAVLLTVRSPAVEAVAGLQLTGLHLAHPDAGHPLLERLGARPADAAVVLAHRAVRAAVERSVDDADAGLDTAPLAAAVLALLSETGSDAAPPWIGALALPEDGGGVRRADELLFPDAALRPLLAPDAPLGVLGEVGAPREVLAAAGVVDGFVVLLDDTPTAPDHDLDDEERWWDDRDVPPSRLRAVRDLDLVAAGAWSDALALLAADPGTRAAVLEPGGYTGWWLARHARPGGRRPSHWRLPSATGIAALYDAVPLAAGRPAAAPADPAGPAQRAARSSDSVGRAARSSVGAGATVGVEAGGAQDGAFLTAIGVRADLTVAEPHAAADLLARLADPARHPDPALAAQAHAALAAAVADGRVDPVDLDPPDRVRALDGTVAAVDLAVVLDHPWLAAVLPPGETVAGGEPEDLAALLDLPLASEVVAATVEGTGERRRWAEIPEIVLACAALHTAVPEGELTVHETLSVRVTRPVVGRRTVLAWCDGDHWHASDPLRALVGLLAAAPPGTR